MWRLFYRLSIKIPQRVMYLLNGLVRIWSCFARQFSLVRGNGIQVNKLSTFGSSFIYLIIFNCWHCCQHTLWVAPTSLNVKAILSQSITYLTNIRYSRGDFFIPLLLLRNVATLICAFSLYISLLYTKQDFLSVVITCFISVFSATLLLSPLL
jgi:hypothetical protein